MCGGEIRPTNIRGERWPYRDAVDLLIDEDLFMPVCAACGEMMLDEGDSKRLDEVLQRAYEEHRHKATEQLIVCITRDFNITQGEIEQILGMSTGYISKVKRREKMLSAQAFRTLFMLSEEPYTMVSTYARIDPRLMSLAERLQRFQHDLSVG